MKYMITLELPIQSTPKNYRRKAEALMERMVRQGHLPEGTRYVRARRVDGRKRAKRDGEAARRRRVGQYDAMQEHNGQSFPLAPAMVKQVVRVARHFVSHRWAEEWAEANRQFRAQRRRRRGPTGLSAANIGVWWSRRLRAHMGYANQPAWQVDGRTVRNGKASIRLMPTLNPRQAARTLLHELAHVFLGWVSPGEPWHGQSFDIMDRALTNHYNEHLAPQHPDVGRVWVAPQG